MTDEVWALLPPRVDDARTEPILRLLRDECRERGWKMTVRHTYSLVDKPFLSPTDTVALYGSLHRRSVAILSIQAPGNPGPYFFTRPPQAGTTAYRAENIGSVRSLCRHKGFFYRWRWDREASNWPQIFIAWKSAVGCSGTHDPRCLPLHVFRCGRHWNRHLLRAEGRAAFDDQYGTGHSRTDERGFRWEKGPAHGRDVRIVSGCELPAGFQWDVQGSGEFWTPKAGWLVRRYVNVAPDATAWGKEPHVKPIRLRVPLIFDPLSP